MKKSFIVKELGYSNFDKALKIGWLNHVGFAAESASREKVYAFYHATFEEYFAALAVESWHYFLRHDPDEPETGTYRIFEPQWREVILLWLGREDVDDEPKNQFIEELIKFDSGCGSFYYFDAYFLAAAGIAEFGNCSRADEIVKQIVMWSIGYSDIEEQQGVKFSEPLIAREANLVLLETDRIRAIAVCENLLQSQDERICLKAAEILKKIDSGNPTAIAVCENLLQSQDERICLKAAKILKKIDSGKILQRSQHWRIYSSLKMNPSTGKRQRF